MHERIAYGALLTIPLADNAFMTILIDDMHKKTLARESDVVLVRYRYVGRIAVRWYGKCPGGRICFALDLGGNVRMKGCWPSRQNFVPVILHITTLISRIGTSFTGVVPSHLQSESL